MRLINTDTLVIEEFGFGEIPNYAILSHRWYKYELTLQDVQNRIWENKDFTNENKIKAFEKLNRCCVRAKSDAFQYVWIDSCCIDKTSSAELSEAINSMYIWYYKAGRCYAYLSDVQSWNTFRESEWFTRAVSDQTRIPGNILSGADLETATVAQRMSWASQRKTTRVEDRAYCLMGIFGINMPLLYGEGERAFIRLQEEIMRISNDHSIFCWKSSDTRGGLLATSPDAFSESNNIIHYNPFSDFSAPLTVSSRGIHLELRFIGLPHGGVGIAILPCAERDRATKLLAIYVKDKTLTMELFERVRSESFESIDINDFRRWRYPIRQMCIRMGRMAPMGRAENFGNQNDITDDIYDYISFTRWMNSPSTSDLFRAAREGEQYIIWSWLTRSDITANLADDRGRTVLWHAVVGGHEALVRMLLARRDVNADFQDATGQTPFSWAIQRGREAMVKLLLEKKTRDNSRRRAPLMWALLEGQEATARLLLENGADIETRDCFGQTPLLLTAEKGYEGAVKLLLENGADIKARDGSESAALSMAAENGHEAVVGLLLENGADIETRGNYGGTPLSLAARKGHEATVKLLLENGADIEARDGHESTPLLEAAKNGHMAVVELLLENGANEDAKDKDGETPRSYAKGNKAHRIIMNSSRNSHIIFTCLRFAKGSYEVGP
ncbi:putative ankyrin repeat-containing protein [Trichoderma pleuroticola]